MFHICLILVWYLSQCRRWVLISFVALRLQFGLLQSNLFYICLAFVCYLLNICQIFVWFLFGFLLDFCLIFVWYLFDFWIWFVLDVCLIFVWYLFDFCFIFVWYLAKCRHKILCCSQIAIWLVGNPGSHYFRPMGWVGCWTHSVSDKKSSK